VTPSNARRPRAFTVGVALFVVGLVAIVVDVLPFFDGRHNTALWLNLLCVLAPIGFILAVWSVLRAGRREQREAVRRLGA